MISLHLAWETCYKLRFMAGDLHILDKNTFHASVIRESDSRKQMAIGAFVVERWNMVSLDPIPWL